VTLIEEHGAGTRRAVASSAWAAVYDCHVAEVHRYVHRRCGDRSLAEDVTQDTFLAAVSTVDDPDELTIGWLIRVARNRLIDVLRRQTRHETKLRLVRPGDRGDRGDQIELVAERLRVREALETLKVEHRLVLMLHYVDGYTVAALADELDRSPKAAEALVTRARRNLLKELERDDG
jgi:RNA polymerase sigma-70 factor (ECF subfamily)